MQELYDAYRAYGLQYDAFVGADFMRIKEIKRLQNEELLDTDLRWKQPANANS